MKKPSIRETVRIIEGLGTVNAQTNRRLHSLRSRMPLRDESAPRPPLYIGLHADAEAMPNVLHEYVMEHHPGTQKNIWNACGIGETEWTRFHQNKTLPDEKLIWRLVFGLPFFLHAGDAPLYEKSAKHTFSLIDIHPSTGEADTLPSLETEAVDQLILGLDAAKRSNEAQAKAGAERAEAYSAETAQTIRETLAAQAENALMLYIYTHLPADIRTNADIYRRCGISADTWTQMKKNLHRPAFGVLARLAVGLRMTADEAESLLCIAWAQRSQFAGVLRGMWMSGVSAPEDIDELLSYWFPEDAEMRLYGHPAIYRQMSAAYSDAMDERVLANRKKEKRPSDAVRSSYRPSPEQLALFRGYDDDEIREEK